MDCFQYPYILNISKPTLCSNLPTDFGAANRWLLEWNPFSEGNLHQENHGLTNQEVVKNLMFSWISGIEPSLEQEGEFPRSSSDSRTNPTCADDLQRVFFLSTLSQWKATHYTVVLVHVVVFQSKFQKSRRQSMSDRACESLFVSRPSLL